MLTLFACPKPFRGHFAVIQRNAIRSWALLRPQPEIFLFGDEEGTARAAADLGVHHIPEVARNEFGTPLLDGTFGQARQVATFDLLCYVNADIILLPDFMAAVERVSRWRSHFLMVGRRWDVDIRKPWDFDRPDASEWLKDLALRTGTQRAPEWVDYFAFTKDFVADILPLALGRTGWDNWLIWHARTLKFPIVDASRLVMAIHQNHDYSHYPGGEAGVRGSEEARRNLTLIGGRLRYYNTADATHVLSSTQIELNSFHWIVKFDRAVRRYYAPLWLAFLDLTRPVRHRLGLRKKRDPKSTGTPMGAL